MTGWRIAVDHDLTADATHAPQQLALFNGIYSGWCYLPLVAFLTFDDERRQYLVAALRARLDGGFASPAISICWRTPAASMSSRSPGSRAAGRSGAEAGRGPHGGGGDQAVGPFCRHHPIRRRPGGNRGA